MRGQIFDDVDREIRVAAIDQCIDGETRDHRILVERRIVSALDKEGEDQFPGPGDFAGYEMPIDYSEGIARILGDKPIIKFASGVSILQIAQHVVPQGIGIRLRGSAGIDVLTSCPVPGSAGEVAQQDHLGHTAQEESPGIGSALPASRNARWP